MTGTEEDTDVTEDFDPTTESNANKKRRKKDTSFTATNKIASDAPYKKLNWVNTGPSSFNTENSEEFVQKKRRRRTAITEQKLLEEYFAKNDLPSAEERQKIAEETGLTPRGVQVWFQNRRQSLKKRRQQAEEQALKREKELLSNSLPNVDPSNPHQQLYNKLASSSISEAMVNAARAQAAAMTGQYQGHPMLFVPFMIPGGGAIIGAIPTGAYPRTTASEKTEDEGQKEKVGKEREDDNNSDIAAMALVDLSQSSNNSLGALEKSLEDARNKSYESDEGEYEC